MDEIRGEDLLGDYPAVRYYPPSGDLYFDILTRLGETASFENVASEIKEIEGIRVPVAIPAAGWAALRETVRAQGGEIVRVQKFRSVEEMNAARVPVSNENVFERFLRHCARYWTISPRTYPRGVFRYRSIEEAQAARQRPPRA